MIDRLSKQEQGRPATPVRTVHIGVGNFFRAHQAWFTARQSTVTEAGYRRATDGALDLADPDVAVDIEALSADPDSDSVATTPGRLVVGLLARHAADAGPVALVPCDNVPDSCGMVARVVRDLAAVSKHEQRKLWLLNGSHPRIRHLLAQIAADGSRKVPIRFGPALAAEVAAGRAPLGATRPVAAWLAHLHGHGAPVVESQSDVVSQPSAAEPAEAVRTVLGWMGISDPSEELVAQVLSQSVEFERQP